METTMHYFNTEIAAQYGMVEATILNHLKFWIQKNKEKNINYHDGRYWTFNSVREFCKLFPYLTAKKIRNAIKKLEDAKILIKGNFNKVKYDRTTWYAFTDFGLRLFACEKKQEEKPETKVELEPEVEVELEKQNTKKNMMQIPPKTEDVQAYCEKRNSCINVQRFLAYYTANGWHFGRKKMKKTADWQAAVRYWEQTEKPVDFGSQGKTTQNRNRFCNYTQREWDYKEIERLEWKIQHEW